MKDRFTDKALAVWESLDRTAQKLIVQNVWCGQCCKTVTITAFSGHLDDGDLALEGKCANCGGEVARLVESE